MTLTPQQTDAAQEAFDLWLLTLGIDKWVTAEDAWLHQQSRINALEEENAWQPIETAPKKNGGRAIWVANSEGMEPVHWRYPLNGPIKIGWINCYTDKPIDWNPTHWSQLPERPSKL